MKLTYKVFIMHATEGLDFACVTNGADYSALYLRMSDNIWRELIHGNAFYSTVEKSFRKRNSGALHVSSFVDVADIVLPPNRAGTAVILKQYDDQRDLDDREYVAQHEA